MKKIKYSGIDLDVYYDKIENGLEIFVIPMEKMTTTFATFTSKYGSAHNNFKLEGEKGFNEVPDGIAHFLEHKMFETKEGIDPFTFYSKSGSSCNANTWNYRTVYLFEALSNFKDNLNYLLDFVQECYLTESNVQKEKGIITEEAKMYYDHPSARLDIISNDISFHKDYMKNPVIGTFESINAITKEELELCYNTFYHPSNMFLIVTGPVDYKEVLDIVKTNQNTKSFINQPRIIFKNEKEPDNIVIEYKEDFMEIEIPRIEMNYKISFEKYKKLDKNILLNYFEVYASLIIGNTSDFAYEMVSNERIVDNFEVNTVYTKDHLMLQVYFSSNDYKDIIKLVDDQIKSFNVIKDDFEIRKNRLISSYIARKDSIFGLNYSIIENYTIYGKLPFDEYNEIKKMSYEEMISLVSKEDFNNLAVAVLRPKIN